MKKSTFIIFVIAGLLTLSVSCKKEAAYRAVIITGQSSENWKASSPVLSQILEASGLFTCDVAVSPQAGKDMSKFSPDFSKYNLVVLNYNGDEWPEKTKKAFVDYVNNGGGVVVYRAADNAFPGWKEYNEIIGVGGWGGRTEKDGPYAYFRNNKMVLDSSAGIGGSARKMREFEVRTRNMDHPITKGFPARWVHGKDSLYSRLRGPARNIEILATTYADTSRGGSGRDEPALMTIAYGKGRIFHTTLGYTTETGGPAIECAGFITSLQRGAEWAVTGSVTQALPNDLPNAAAPSFRSAFKPLTLEEDFLNIVTYDIGKTTKYLVGIQSEIRSAAGDSLKMLNIEKMMVKVLKMKEATVESKKLMLRELSWMGTEYCIPAIKELTGSADLKDEADFALERLQPAK